MKKKNLVKKSAAVLAGLAVVLVAVVAVNGQFKSAQATSWFDGARTCNQHIDCMDINGTESGNFADQQIQTASYYGVCDYNTATSEKICVRQVDKINGLTVSGYKLLVTDQQSVNYVFLGDLLGIEPICIQTEPEYPYGRSKCD